MMICRRMLHVVYRSNGVARAALGAAKKIDLTAPEIGRWPLVTKEGDLARMTDAWLRRCGMCFAPVSRGETFRTDSDPGARSTRASDDGVHLVSGPESLLSLEVRHLAESAEWTARTSRCIETVPIRLADKPPRLWDGPKEASIRSSLLLSTVSAGQSDSISLLDRSMTSGPASRSKPSCTAAGPLPTGLSIRMVSGIALQKAARWSASPQKAPVALPIASTAASMRIDTRLRTTLPASNATVGSRLVTRSLPSPSSASSSSLRCSIGSLMRFE